jgi:type VI secretion system secreted protein Hcp
MKGTIGPRRWRMAVVLATAVVLSTTAIALAQSQALEEAQETEEERCPETMPFPLRPADDLLTPSVFLRMDSVDGGATRSGHEGEIEIFGWSWSVHRFEHMHFYGGYPGEGQTLELHKRLDRATPALIQAALEGRRFSEAVLTTREPGEEGAEIARITLSDVGIVYAHTGRYPGEGGYPSEQLSLSFSDVRFEYLELDGEVFSFEWASR